MFSVRYDPKNGIIRCVTGGFKSVADVQQHSKAVHEDMQRSYREFGKVAMLVIDSGTMVQSSKVMEEVKADLQRFRAEDRIATVASSQLVKLQATRTLGSNQFRIFASEPEAMAWLTADQPARHGVALQSATA